MKANVIGAVAAVLLAGWMAGTARAGFELRDTQHLDVTIRYTKVTLYEASTADVLAGGYIEDATVTNAASLHVRPGGSVGWLEAYEASTVDISGGSVGHFVAYGTGTVDISGGSVGTVYAQGTRTVDITGGTGTALYANNSSTVDISGGSVSYLYACDSSTVTLHGYDFRATGGLSLDGDKVLGTGILTGRWYGPDNTMWAIPITTHAAGATILAVPEPATLSLLALAGLAVIRRKK